MLQPKVEWYRTISEVERVEIGRLETTVSQKRMDDLDVKLTLESRIKVPFSWEPCEEFLWVDLQVYRSKVTE